MSKSRKFAALIPIIAGILVIFSYTARAQDDDEDHGLYLAKPRIFYGGLIAGGSAAQVDGDYYAGYRKFGINAGGIVYAQLAKHLALSLEILYSQKGSKSNGIQGTNVPNVVVLKYGVSANYAEIPLMINYFDRQKSHFGVGVSYGQLVSSSESVTVDSLGARQTIDLGARYPFKKSDFNLLAGVELHLVKGLFMNIRFQYSITPIRSGSGLPPAEYARTDQYNNLWIVRLMYLVNGK